MLDSAASARVFRTTIDASSSATAGRSTSATCKSQFRNYSISKTYSNPEISLRSPPLSGYCKSVCNQGLRYLFIWPPFCCCVGSGGGGCLYLFGGEPPPPPPWP